LKKKAQEFDEALRDIQALVQKALEEDTRFVHYSTGESVDTGVWGLNDVVLSEAKDFQDNVRDSSVAALHQNDMRDSLSDRVEVAIVSFLQKNPQCIYLEIEDELYPRFPGLLTPSKAMIYAVLDSYAERNAGVWILRGEDVASARRSELETIRSLLEKIGTRLGFTTSKERRNYLWQANGQTFYALHIFASALVRRAIAATPYPPEQTILVIPGGRAALVSYKEQRDPALAKLMEEYRVVKYRLLRTLVEVPVLSRETFEEQIASDPLEKSQAQMMMF
jgi:hypothetical protein